MMYNHKILLLTAGTLIVFILLFVPLRSVVFIINAKTNQPILYLCLKDQEEFIISFTHSVNKRPVYDYIRLDQKNLLIVKSRFDAFGAGMPEVAPEGAILHTVHGTLELDNINLPMTEITLFVGTVANHTLTANGSTIFLTDIAPPGTPLTFKIARISNAELWKGRCL